MKETIKNLIYNREILEEINKNIIKDKYVFEMKNHEKS